MVRTGGALGLPPPRTRNYLAYWRMGDRRRMGFPRPRCIFATRKLLNDLTADYQLGVAIIVEQFYDLMGDCKVG